MKKQTPLPTHSNRRVRASFARAAVHMAFGRHARALDWDDFVDRPPGAASAPSLEARFK